MLGDLMQNLCFCRHTKFLHALPTFVWTHLCSHVQDYAKEMCVTSIAAAGEVQELTDRDFESALGLLGSLLIVTQ